MRVLQINQSINTGSIGRTTFELSVELNKRGYQSFVIYEEGMPIPNSYRIVSRFGYKMHALLSRITGMQGYFSIVATLRALRRIKQFAPDIVHLRNLHGNFICMPLLFRYLAKNNIATVVTLHDLWLLTGKCTYPIASKCERYTQHCGCCPIYKGDVIPSWFFDTSKKCLYDKKRLLNAIPKVVVVGVSEWAATVARSSYMKHRDIVVIYNWIDLDIFCNRESNLRQNLNLEERFVVLFVSASFNRIKGYDEICWVANNCPSNWQIVAIGEKPLPLPQNVLQINHTNNAVELAEYYSMADVCVNLTQYETFGKVTAEAICCGTPVVVYNNTASPELVDEKCGVVIDQRKGFDAITEALSEICKKGKSAYSANCRAYAESKFSKTIGVEKYIHLYESLLRITAL